MRRKIRFAVLAGGVMMACPVIGMAAASDLTVQNPWSRPAAVGQTGVVYLTVTDTGAPDQLIGVRSPEADEAQLHESRMNGGVMEMRPVAAVPVAAGQPLVLSPGGYHIMLMGLKRPLKEGDVVAVTLVFQKAGAIAVQSPVQRNAPKP